MYILQAESCYLELKQTTPVICSLLGMQLTEDSDNVPTTEKATTKASNTTEPTKKSETTTLAPTTTTANSNKEDVPKKSSNHVTSTVKKWTGWHVKVLLLYLFKQYFYGLTHSFEKTNNLP